MAAETITPLTTLEVRHTTGGPNTYTGYWAEFSEVSNLTDPLDIKKTHDLGSYVARLTSHVIRDADPFSVALMHDMRTDLPQQQTISSGVKEWDRTLGSRNSLQDAQGDLLRAAGLLWYSNLEEDTEFMVPTTDSDEVYERFMSLMDNNSLEQQKPTADLLLAGQLVHKAGWVEGDAQRQDDLFAKAVRIYERIHDDPAALWVDRLTAGQYKADILFHWLNHDMRTAVKYQDVQEQAKLRDTAIDLLGEMAIDLLQAGRLHDQSAESQKAVGGFCADEWVGFMLDGFAPLAVRDMFYVRSKPSVAARYEVRKAFQHEDEPRTLKLQPKQSFDVVLQRRDVDGNVAETYARQLKLRSYRHKPRAGQRDKDYKGTPCIGFYGLSSRIMVAAIDNLLVSYAERQFHSGNSPLNMVQELFATIDNRLVSASV